MRAHRDDGGEGGAGGGRHVLELERDDIEVRSGRRQEGRVGVVSDVEPVAVVRGRAVGDVGDRLDAVAHASGRLREHRPELAAAENPEHAPGQHRAVVSQTAHRSDTRSDHSDPSPETRSASTRAVCSAR